MYLGKETLIPFTEWRYLKNNLNVLVECIGRDQVWLSPECKLASGVTLYPGTQIRGKSFVGAGSIIETNSIIENSHIGEQCIIGPHALVENSHIGNTSHIGFTAQVKRSVLGVRNVAVHHCYIGDTTAQDNVNFGAGSITGNFDGTKKNSTFIGRGAFIGVNVNLVAPLTVGRNAFIAAGLTIRQNVAAHTFLVPSRATEPRASRGTLPQKTNVGYERFRIGADVTNALRHYFGEELDTVLCQPLGAPYQNGATLLDLLRHTGNSITKKVELVQTITQVFRAREAACMKHTQ